MKKGLVLAAVAALIVVSQVTAFAGAACCAVGKDGKTCKTNFGPGNKHAKNG